MIVIRSLIFAVGMIALCRFAMAHPGHGDRPSAEITHYLFEPIHVGPLVLGCLALIAMRFVWLRRSAAKRGDV